MKEALQKFFETYVFSPAGFSILFWLTGWGLFAVSNRFLLDWLRNRPGMKWAPREDTPDSHLQKAGTPSMGGIGIIGSACAAFFGAILFVFVTALLLRDQRLKKELLLIFIFPVFVGLHAVLGYVDDLSKARNRGGLSSKAKLLGQIVLASGFVLVLYLLPDKVLPGVGLLLTPGFWKALFNSPWTVAICVLLIIGTSNAVNLTDGIDGLVAGLTIQTGLVFTFLAVPMLYKSGGMIDLGGLFFWLCLAGASLGFLGVNKYPAKIFMGDTGSLAIGAALGAGAVLSRSIWLLPFIGFIFYIEMFSVIFQVAYFKITRKLSGEGKRLFLRAPLHHHFELKGWSEWRVVLTFWAINLVTSAIGLALWQAGYLPRFP